MDGWVDGFKSRFKEFLQQSIIIRSKEMKEIESQSSRTQGWFLPCALIRYCSKKRITGGTEPTKSKS